MSEEQLNRLLEALKSDKSLQEKLKAATSADSFSAVAKEAGFDISPDEIQQAQQLLSEEELDGVAGGGGCGNCTSTYGATLDCTYS